MVRYVRFYTRWHRRENDQFSTLRCTKTGSTQPKLSAACFVVQSCLADADFVVFSNYCLIGTRQMHSVFYLFFEFLLILFADFRSQSIFFQITVQGNTTDIKHSCQFTDITAGRFPGRNKSVFIIFPGFFKRPVTRQLDII